MSHENETVADQIFGSIGGLIDGAVSVAGDILDYKLLEKEIESQRSPAPSYSENNYRESGGGFSIDTGSKKTQAFMIYGALALSTIATAAAIAK